MKTRYSSHGRDLAVRLGPDKCRALHDTEDEVAECLSTRLAECPAVSNADHRK